MFEVHQQLFCPVCGREVEFAVENQDHCSHVEYIYGWGECGGWVYATPEFASEYVRAIKGSQELIDHLVEVGDDDFSVADEEFAQFGRAEFEPEDDLACSIPCIPSKVERGSGLEFIVIWGVGYSGVYVGISNREE
ncbi:MAG: hypothetical protein K8R59_00090 [Thermoanaerobaculales bacterium]|nr:hypothetical protein [Thermoanaerobaculales bacterium]